MEKVREVVFFRHYFEEFYELQAEKVKEKIDYVLFLMTHAEQVPEKFLKHMEGQKGLYEIRVAAGHQIFRIFCCFDKGKVIVLFNGFRNLNSVLRTSRFQRLSKTMKTPGMEIKMAMKLMMDYFNDK